VRLIVERVRAVFAAARQRQHELERDLRHRGVES
jgi:hypothetical protein